MTEMAALALAAGVAVQPLSGFQVTQPPRAGLALGYGAVETDDIIEGLLRPSRAFESG